MKNQNKKTWAWITPPRGKTSVPGSTYSNDERYNSRQWRKMRYQFLRENPLCVECHKSNRVSQSTVADHIKPVTSGGEFWDIDNLQALCASCHGRKSAIEGNEKRKNDLNAI